MTQNPQLETITHRASHQGRGRAATAARHRAGFTLIEIMVALAIFAVMMSIIFVPLNLGLKLFHIGKTRSDTLQAAQTTMDQMEGELRKAIYVFPNEALPGVTDRAPFQIATYNPDGHPYVRVASSTYGVCDTDTANATYVDNPSRLDFLLPDNFDINTGASGTEQLQPISPLQPASYLVTYYPRRQNATLAAEPFENPIVLFRAQMPYREHNGVVVPDPTPTAAPPPNVNLSSSQNSRYPDPATGTPCTTNSTYTNRGSYWLNQLYDPADPTKQTNESNLEPLCFDSTGAGGYPSVPGTHTLMLPRGVSLLARRAYDPLPDGTVNSNPDYTPDTTFHGQDTDGDHKIDQVTITLVLSSFDEIGADRQHGTLNDQRIRLTQTISLPNVR